VQHHLALLAVDQNSSPVDVRFPNPRERQPLLEGDGRLTSRSSSPCLSAGGTQWNNEEDRLLSGGTVMLRFIAWFSVALPLALAASEQPAKPHALSVFATMGLRPQQIATIDAVVIKQLYPSHYFHTALDISVCVDDTTRPESRGFYLLTLKGSEQDGLTGIKGSTLRKIIVGKTRSSLESALAAIKRTVEESAPPSAR